MSKTELERLISSLLLGAKKAVAQEDRARADWVALCRNMPKREPKKAGPERDRYRTKMLLQTAACNALGAYMRVVDAFAQPFCTLLPAYDHVSTLAERIKLINIHESHFGNLSESSGCLWMVASKMEASRDVIEEELRDRLRARTVWFGPAYESLHRHLMDHRDLLERDEVDLVKQFPFGVAQEGGYVWSEVDGERVREWKPWAIVEEWEY